MLTGEKELIGSGFIRDVYLVEWEGRKLAVKFLREDFELRASEGSAENLHRWEAAALDAVRDPLAYLHSEALAFRAYFVPSLIILNPECLKMACGHEAARTPRHQQNIATHLVKLLPKNTCLYKHAYCICVRAKPQVRGHPNIVGMLGVCGASSVSDYYATHLDDLVLSPGAAPLPISTVVSSDDHRSTPTRLPHEHLV